MLCYHSFPFHSHLMNAIVPRTKRVNVTYAHIVSYMFAKPEFLQMSAHRACSRKELKALYLI